MPPVLQNLVDRLGAGRAVVLVLVGVGAVAAIWVFSRWATAPAWIELYPGIPIESVAEVTTGLEEANVPYRLTKGGASLEVHEADLARARVLLARDGFATPTRPGMELFDQPAWGMTDFTQRVNYRRALEGELERTIGEMRGIEGAKVHLAMHETSIFRRTDRPAEASVFLKLRSGVRPPEELVEAVTYLVASSVGGMSSRNVTVLDDAGRVLTAAVELGVPGALSQRHLAMRREIEHYLEAKAEQLVGEIVGPENVRIRVSAAVNFDRVDRTVQAVDPDQQVVTREERSEIVPGANATGAGSVVESTSYEMTRRVETYSGAVGTIERLTVAVLVNERPAGAASSPEALGRVEALVRNAVGIDATRGDAITVVSVPFDVAPAAAPVEEEGIGFWPLVQMLYRPAIGALAVVLAFILALQVVRALRRPGSQTAAVVSAPVEVPAAPASDAPSAEPRGQSQVEAQMQPKPFRLPSESMAEDERLRGRERVVTAVAERPENAARVVRAWMRDA